ncbi:MAG: SH3 domain-containing protein [Candidatus Methylophosphatis roskildensis]
MKLHRIAGLVLALFGLPVGAVEFRSVSEPSLLYDAPSSKADPKFIIARGTPVELVVNLGKWVKVRDSGGGLLWIERAKLAERRTVIVTAASAAVLESAAESAPVVFEAAKDVVLELLEAAPVGWAKVRHRDGQSGFVRVSQVWGL